MSLSSYERYIKEALTPEEIEAKKKAALASHMKMYLSKDLTEILKRMSSPIANDLLTLSRRNILFDISFMDVVEGGMVTYISTMKVKKMEENGLDIKKARTNYNSELWKSSQRVQPTRINKVIGKIFRGRYSQAEIEKFGNEFKAKEKSQDDKMKVIYGNEIKKYYHQNMYSSLERGTLASSCMRYAEKQSYFGLYVENAPSDNLKEYQSHVGMLVLLDDDKRLLGRALVWFNSIRPEPGRTFMDRIYTTNDSDIITFTDYAKRNGWLYKSQQTYNNPTYIDPRDNSKHNLTLSFRLKPKEFPKYPFMDTLLYYTPDTGRISTVPPKTKKYTYYKIQSVDGNAQRM